jgi:hypothetical protein
MMTKKEFTESVSVIENHSCNTFLKLRFDHLRHLKGDMVSAVILSYLLNLLHMKSNCDKDKKLLQKHEMWFRCPSKKIEHDLGIKESKRRRSVECLQKMGLLEIDNRQGNVTWVRIPIEGLRALERSDPTVDLENDVIEDESEDDTQTFENQGANPLKTKVEEPLKTKVLYKTNNLTKNLSNNCHSRDGFKDDVEKPKDEKPTPTSNNQTAQVHLLEDFTKDVEMGLKRAKKYKRDSNRDIWTDHLNMTVREIKERDNITWGEAFRHVKKVLTYHLSNLSSPYHIKAYSLVSMEERFIDIESSWQRQLGIEKMEETKKITEEKKKNGGIDPKNMW